MTRPRKVFWHLGEEIWTYADYPEKADLGNKPFDENRRFSDRLLPRLSRNRSSEITSRFQKKECLDVRWRNPERIRPEDLAFGGDRKALGLWADIKSGKAKPERDYTSEDGRSRSGGANQRKRQRATALVVKDGRYLLVRDKGHDKYSLPGGGMEQGEAALTAACRELGEELGMKAYRAERLFDYTNEGSFNDHKVVLVFAGGEPKINDRELESFRWWDGRERLPVYPHVTSIVSRYETG